VRPTGVAILNIADALADWIEYEKKQLPCILDHFTRMITDTLAPSLVRYLDDARAQLTATALTGASAPLAQIADRSFQSAVRSRLKPRMPQASWSRAGWSSARTA
jgi:hypothetical protein